MFEAQNVVLAVLSLVIVAVVICGWQITIEERKNTRTAREKIAGKKFVVAIRTKDGKRNYWETLFIKQLMALGATVLDCSPDSIERLWIGDRNYIPSGCMGFVGTTWEDKGIYYLDGKFLPIKTKDPLVEPEPILAPFYSVHSDTMALRNNIVSCISRFFK